jgi:amino acid transporter
MSRDTFGDRGAGRSARWGSPVIATFVVAAAAVVIFAVYVAVSTDRAGVTFNAFLWSGTIGTLILLVVYVLATIGMSRLVFVQRKLPGVPMWQVAIPVAAIVVLGYTLYRNVWPYPTGDGRWFPIVGGIWLAVAVIGVIVAPRTARRLGEKLAAREGIKAD